MADADCTCGHPQSRHKGGKQGCRGCDIGCSRYEPETRPEPVEPVPTEELATVADEAPECTCAMTEASLVNCAVHGYDAPKECCVGEPFMGDPGGLHTFDCPVYQASQAALMEQSKAAQPVPEPVLPPSTSARLREVERDLAEARLNLTRAERERDSLARRCSVRFEETQAVKAELASAEQVTEQQRAELSAANGRIRDLACEVEQLGAQLEHAEQYARDLQDNGDVMPVDGVLVAVDAQHCPPCGWTSSYETHHHPTIGVRVVIHRTQGAPR